jgi:hypothetical protein
MLCEGEGPRRERLRLLPPARRPHAQLDLPSIVDGESYLAAVRLVMLAAARGEISPSAATALLRSCGMAFDATRLVARLRR